MGCSSGRRNSPTMKLLGSKFLGHQGPRRWDVPDRGTGMSRTITLCKVIFSVGLAKEWPGCPAIWVGTSRDHKTLRKKTLG